MSVYPRTRLRSYVIITSALLVIFATGKAQAELVFSLYGGFAKTLDSDVTLLQLDGTDLMYKDVSWKDKSFEAPFYYGLRLSYWIHGLPNLGIAVDFTHAKMYAELNETVTVTGLRNATFVNRSERLGDSFDELAFSHGHNLLTGNILYRFFPKDTRDGTFLGRIQPYLGVGFGIALPHVEVEIDGVRTEESQTTGPVAQVLGGMNFDVIKHLSVFLEYKLNYVNMNVDLVDGGKLELGPWANNFILGLSAYF